jgi:uncharacterized protein with HEPN domain
VKDNGRRNRYLVDEILNHADVIALNVRKGREFFETDTTARYAVEHATELIAEAAEKLGRPFKSANPLVPWDRLRELRRGLAHPYDPGADRTHIEQTWRFSREDLPGIIRKLRTAKFPVDPAP